MFAKPIYVVSTHARHGFPQVFSESVATFGLLVGHLGMRRDGARSVVAVRRRRVHHGGVLVHRVDIVRESGGDARASGDRHVRRDPSRRRAGFIVAQLIGAAAATMVFRWLVPALPTTARTTPFVPEDNESSHAASDLRMRAQCRRSQMAAAFFTDRADPAKAARRFGGNADRASAYIPRSSRSCASSVSTWLPGEPQKLTERARDAMLSFW